ncbi:hypothetical protein [Kribbella sp. NPDC048915]|uniref:hypothetical protein n=1 Tax=Kribbella sp. NPDC048915 TaxID=3155148 RepID=UPI0033C01DE4
MTDDNANLIDYVLQYCAVALLGIAAVFDALYLITTPGRIGLAAAYSAPIVAAVLGGIVIAAIDGGWPRRLLGLASAATVVAGVTNMVLVLALGGMLTVGPHDWGRGILTVLFSGAAPVLAAVCWWLLRQLYRPVERVRELVDAQISPSRISPSRISPS